MKLHTQIWIVLKFVAYLILKISEVRLRKTEKICVSRAEIRLLFWKFGNFIFKKQYEKP
jgi:hypothetical protein